MDKQKSHLYSRVLLTPKTAAVAGIIFAVLQSTSLILIWANVPAVATDPGGWLSSNAKAVSLALTLTPFAGIAFLWYMGVMRDRMGRLEDQFFSTLFLGSGILYLAMTFVASAMASGLMTAYALNPDTVLETDFLIYLRAIIYKTNNVSL